VIGKKALTESVGGAMLPAMRQWLCVILIALQPAWLLSGVPRAAAAATLATAPACWCAVDRLVASGELGALHGGEAVERATPRVAEGRACCPLGELAGADKPRGDGPRGDEPRGDEPRGDESKAAATDRDASCEVAVGGACCDAGESGRCSCGCAGVPEQRGPPAPAQTTGGSGWLIAVTGGSGHALDLVPLDDAGSSSAPPRARCGVATSPQRCAALCRWRT